jgi:hypothetical protein
MTIKLIAVYDQPDDAAAGASAVTMRATVGEEDDKFRPLRTGERS